MRFARLVGALLLAALLAPGSISNGGGGVRSITFVLSNSGAALTTGDLNFFPTILFPSTGGTCTIFQASVSGNASGSITVDIWKKAAAIPTSADKISASAPVTLSSAQYAAASSISGWTTGVANGDVFGATVATVSTLTGATVQVWCR